MAEMVMRLPRCPGRKHRDLSMMVLEQNQARNRQVLMKASEPGTRIFLSIVFVFPFFILLFLRYGVTI